MKMGTQNLQELAESFAFFSDWEDRYRYLIDLGKQIEVMDNSMRVPENIVRGCTSQVWLVAGWQGKKFHFEADSDAQIIRGLIYILMLAFQDKTAEEIAGLDINSTFEELGLDRHLSPNRRNGFFAMVEKIKTLARGVDF